MIKNRPLRLVVADDSALARQLLVALLEQAGGIEVVGEAADGQQAIELVRRHQPDLLTLDLNMPVMDGLQTIATLMHTKALPILVVSSEADAQRAYQALELGALEVIPKPEVSTAEAEEFIRQVRLLAGIPMITRTRRASAAPLPVAHSVALLPSSQPQTQRLVVIASSTGGPQALALILRQLPADFPAPILIAQHMSDGFVEGLALWLNSHTPLHVSVAEDGQLPCAGQVYLSPSESHLVVSQQGHLALLARQQKDIYRPSCDALLLSVAEVFQQRAIGVILTGMGQDGAAGLLAVHQAGGLTLAQDEASSVIFGMNQQAIERGGVDQVLPVTALAEALQVAVRQTPALYRLMACQGG
ncbi:chemotaxis-specific protein-glutamate methyltransferase CheB [Marinospirillum sp. MEB164]|uniref:Protein-glutamate methylesterase/protein-glutamine glutaminase n=1 Tax=Marinospirillum alkalitolerans TaxID=3123374 RepID=A0ABW8PWT9_9GAMM